MRQQSLFDARRAPAAAPARPSHPAELSFDSWSAWVDHCERCAHPAGMARTYELDDKEWTLGVDFQGALQLAREGWPEGTRRAEKQTMTLADKLAPQLVRDEYRFERAPGVCFDMSRVLTGDPDCWIEPYETHVAGPGRPLVLVVNRGALGFIGADVIDRRGVAVAALAILLERAGRACEIRMVYRAAKQGQHISESVLLKRAGEPLNLDVLTFALAHPATHRRLAFGSREGRSNDLLQALQVHPYGKGYGASIDMPESERGDVYVGCMAGGEQWSSVESATAWLRDTLKQQGAIA